MTGMMPGMHGTGRGGRWVGGGGGGGGDTPTKAVSHARSARRLSEVHRTFIRTLVLDVSFAD